eukprot:4900579-Prymnesium_polylepis.1
MQLRRDAAHTHDQAAVSQGSWSSDEHQPPSARHGALHASQYSLDVEGGRDAVVDVCAERRRARSVGAGAIGGRRPALPQVAAA